MTRQILINSVCYFCTGLHMRYMQERAELYLRLKLNTMTGSRFFSLIILMIL